MSTQQDRQGLGAASSRVGAQVTVVDRRALALLVQAAPIEASAALAPCMTRVLLEHGARGEYTPQPTMNWLRVVIFFYKDGN
jgi:hypothetical protein